MKNQYRQGDVFIERVKELPVAARAIEAHDRLVLSVGSSGHMHYIKINDRAPEAILFEAGSERYLLVFSPAVVLQHDTHAPLRLDQGTYRVSAFGAGTQREYTPGAIRNVND